MGVALSGGDASVIMRSSPRPREPRPLGLARPTNPELIEPPQESPTRDSQFSCSATLISAASFESVFDALLLEGSQLVAKGQRRGIRRLAFDACR